MLVNLPQTGTQQGQVIVECVWAEKEKGEKKEKVL